MVLLVGMGFGWCERSGSSFFFVRDAVGEVKGLGVWDDESPTGDGTTSSRGRGRVRWPGWERLGMSLLARTQEDMYDADKQGCSTYQELACSAVVQVLGSVDFSVHDSRRPAAR